MPYLRKYPVGWVAYNVSSMRENVQEDVFLSCDSRLVAVNVGADGACGTLVCDTNQNNAFDPLRSAWLQSAFRVIKSPLGSFNAVGFQLNISGKQDTKGGYFIDFGDGGTTSGYTSGNTVPINTNTPRSSGIIIGQGSWTDGGPFHPGNTNDKHKHGTDADGNPINAQHLWTQSLFYRDQYRDGPLRFENIPYQMGQDQALIVPVHLTYTGADWAWYSTSYFYKTPPPPPYTPYEPPDEPYDPYDPGPPGNPTDPMGTPNPYYPPLGPNNDDGNDLGQNMGQGNGGGLAGDLGQNMGQGNGGGLANASYGLSAAQALANGSFSDFGGGIGTFSASNLNTGPAFNYTGGSDFNSLMGTSSVGAAPLQTISSTQPLNQTAGTFQSTNYSPNSSSAGAFSPSTAPASGKNNNTSPMSGGFSAFAAQGGTTASGTTASGSPYPANTTGAQGDPFVYTASPNNQTIGNAPKSKWASGTANGGIVYHPAETDLRDAASNGMVPPGVTLNTFLVMCAPNAYFGCGVPELVNGGIKAGFIWGVDPTTGDYVMKSIAGSQAPVEAFRFANSSGRFRFFASEAVYGEFNHTNTGNRTYTFPDKSGTVAMTSDITIPNNPNFLLANLAVTGTVFNTTNLSFSVSPNLNYYFKFVLQFTVGTAASGVKVQLTGPAAPTNLLYWSETTNSAGVVVQAASTAAFSTNIGYATATTGVTYQQTIEGVLENGANAGNVVLQFACSTALDVATLLRDSIMIWSSATGD